MKAGFYAPGNGWLHRCDTRVKLFMTLCALGCVIAWGNWIFLVAVFVGIQILFLTDHLAGYAYGRAWSVMGIILGIEALALILSLNTVGSQELWHIGFWRVSVESAALTGRVLLRTVDIMMILLIPLLTTSDEQWTRGLSALHIPYPRIRGFLNALHWIPGVFVASRTIHTMTMARGGVQGFAWRLQLLPAAMQAQSDRMDQMDIARRTRGMLLNRHGSRRSLQYPAHMRGIDWIIVLATIVCTAAVIMMMVFGW